MNLNAALAAIFAVLISWLARHGGATWYRTTLAGVVSFIGFLLVTGYAAVRVFELDPLDTWRVALPVLGLFMAWLWTKHNA